MREVEDIEDDVELVKRYLKNSAYKESDSDFFKNGGWEMVDLKIPKAMANILAEREQKDKRIKELEEENKKLKAQHVFTRNEATDEEKAELYDAIDKTLDTFLEQEKPIWQQEMKTDKMSLEEALNVVDSMYQDRYKIVQENNTIYVDRLKNVEFTNLEFASVRLLREVQSLRDYLENSIPTQVVIDKIEELKKLIEKIKEDNQYSNEIPLYEHDIKLLEELLQESEDK